MTKESDHLLAILIVEQQGLSRLHFRHLPPEAVFLPDMTVMDYAFPERRHPHML